MLETSSAAATARRAASTMSSTAVDKFAAQPQPGEKGGRVGSRPTPIEELVQGGLEPDGDHERGAVRLGQQQRKILWVAHCRKGHRADPEVLDPLESRGKA